MQPLRVKVRIRAVILAKLMGVVATPATLGMLTPLRDLVGTARSANLAPHQYPTTYQTVGCVCHYQWAEELQMSHGKRPVHSVGEGMRG
jgi:hypothetical protein